MLPIIVAVYCIFASTPAAQIAPTERVVTQKNYEIGTPRTISVGQLAVRVKAYREVTNYSLAYRPRQAMTFKAVTTEYRIDPSVPLPLGGVVYVGDKRYGVAEFGRNAGDRVAFLVADDGSIHKNYAAFTRSFGWTKLFLSIKSPSPIFLDLVRLESTARYPIAPDFELIYLGQDETSIRFEFREHLGSGPAAPASPGVVSFPRTARTFQFRDITFAVDAVTEDAITLTVTKDAISTP